MRKQQEVSVGVSTPVEAAENVKTPVFSSVEVHAEDGGEDEQHHGEVEHYHHCGLEGNTENMMLPMEKSGWCCRVCSCIKGFKSNENRKKRNKGHFVQRNEKYFSINIPALPSVHKFQIAKRL